MGASVTARDTILKAALGANRSTLFPAQYYLALYKGDPAAAGVECDSTGGYARVAMSNDGTTFDVPRVNATNSAIREVPTKIALTFPAATGLYSQSALDYWALFDNAAGGVMWFSGTLDTAVTISGAGDQIRVPAGGLLIQG